MSNSILNFDANKVFCFFPIELENGDKVSANKLMKKYYSPCPDMHGECNWDEKKVAKLAPEIVIEIEKYINRQLLMKD